jgi:TatD DNase family protein
MDYFIDSHCHMHDAGFFESKIQDQLLENAFKANVKKMIFIGTTFEDSFKARDFVLSHPEKSGSLFWSYGVHPNEWRRPRRHPEFGENKPIAIGEVGLDYHFFDDSTDIEREKSEQKKMLCEMLDLARENDLPVIFHVREAFDDFFEIIENYQDIRGVIHSFTDNKKNLKKCLERGFYIGVNGMATYSTLPQPPLDRILLETDAPFLAPIPHRGEQNESAYIPDIAKWLAEKTNTNIDEIMIRTSENCKKLFNFA